VSACLAASATPAQSAGSGAPPAAGQLGEIIITTQRRAEDLQSVPLAVTVFDADALRDQRIFDLKSIAERTPSLVVGDFKPGQPQIFIRGIGSNEDGAAADQSVVVFIDEVYVGRTAGQVGDLFDLERVEVLRGPQGTLFGKNVIGGAISLTTKKPTAETDVQLEATYGNLNALTLQGRASGELRENLFGKISFTSRRRDGYVESKIGLYPQFFPLDVPQDLGNVQLANIDTESVRAALSYLPSDRLEINLTVDRSTRDESGSIRYFVPGPGNGGTYYSTDSRAIPNYRNEIRTSLLDDPGRAEIDIWGAMGRVDYDVTPGVRLTSLTSFRNADLYASDVLGTRNMARIRLSTGAGTSSIIGDNPAYETSDTITQEFRAISTGDSRLQWVAGLYYLREDVLRNETSNLGIVAQNASGALIDLLPQVRGGDLQDARTESYAAFAQGSFAVTDRFRVTAGARYTRDDKSISRVGTAGGLVVVQGYVVDASKAWSEVTPKLTLDYQWTPDLFVYATASKGFKSGGWQGLAPNAAVARTPFDPETAWLYEVGAKSEWLDRRLRANIAVFYQDYTDLQVVQSLVPVDAPPTTPAVLYTQNAADAKIQGVELEFTAIPIPDLTVSGNFSYLDTEFSNFFVPDGFRLPVGAPPIESREGNELRRAPRTMASLLARYSRATATGAQISMQADWRFVDKMYGDPDNLEFGAIPSYDLLGARLAYLTPDGKWEFALWGDNLLEEDYFVHNFPNVGSGWAVPGPPRTYGITVNWRL
jgi:iron complex outermembrane receptor protein